VISTRTGLDFHLDFHAQQVDNFAMYYHTHCGHFLLVKNSETAINLHDACSR
jgi:hypothetical protein